MICGLNSCHILRSCRRKRQSEDIGGCKGTTGPRSVNPKTNKPYGLTFPVVTISDMVNAQKLLIDHLGINKIMCISGGSMGGMQALQWAVSYPDIVMSCIPIATTSKHSALQIAFDEVGRQAIMADPVWKDGDYYEKDLPFRLEKVKNKKVHVRL